MLYIILMTKIIALQNKKKINCKKKIKVIQKVIMNFKKKEISQIVILQLLNKNSKSQKNKQD